MLCLFPNKTMVLFIMWHLTSSECFTLHQRKTNKGEFCSRGSAFFRNFLNPVFFFRTEAVTGVVCHFKASRPLGFLGAVLFSNFTFMSIRLTCGGWTLANPIAAGAACWAWLWESDSIVPDVPTLGAWLWPMRPALIQGGWVLRRIKG